LLWALFILTSVDLVAPVRPYTWTVFQRVVPVDGVLRLVALMLVIVPASWAFFVGVLRPLFRQLAAVHIARRIEEHIPGIHNRLVSCIDLERQKGPKASPVFHRRLVAETLERIRGFRPRMILDGLSLRRAGAFAFLAVLAFCLLWAAASHRLPRSLARLFQPFADLPPISDVAYEVQPGMAAVLREEPILFTARVTTEADPQEMHLELCNDAGRPTLTFDLRPDRQDAKVWQTVVDGASLGAGYVEGFRYRVFGGGTWSSEYRIRLVERPVLISVETAVYYQDYMGIAEPHPTPPQAVEVSGPEGGEVEVVVAAQGQVAAGDVQLLRPGTKLIPPHLQAERPWFEEKVPFGATTEGQWSWERLKNRPVHTEPLAVGTHGHWIQGDPIGHAVAAEDVLFAYVWIDPHDPPQTILLQWNDGETWDHGAYWGAERIKEGKPDSPARRSVGKLPRPREWVRLEVPAKAVGLEGKTLRGMAFKLHGGRCFWGRTGTVQTVEPGVQIVNAFPMKQTEDGRWAGRFPLVGSGLFRAELRNEQGHPNKPMKEIRYVALPDKPPGVIVERQGSEMVLATPAAVPLSISAFDDYALDSVSLLVREGETGEYQRRVLERFEVPPRSATLLAQLTEAAGLNLGGQLWYMVEVRDRKGQTARTPEYKIRIAPDANAADHQLEAFEKAQDPVGDRLVQLIAEQKKVQEQIEKLNKEYAPVAAQVREALNEARSKELTEPQKPQVTEQPKMDAQTARRFEQLQQELARLSQHQQQNANAAQQISQDLTRAVEQANRLEMLPRAIAEQMQATQQHFQQMVAQEMKSLGQEMHKGSLPRPQDSPDLKGMEKKGQRLKKELEDAKARLEALAEARKGTRQDLKKALAQLQRELLALDGKMTDRELQELKEFLAKLREEMKGVQQKQEALEKATESGLDLVEAKRRQAELDKDMEELLAKARKLLEARKNRNDHSSDRDAGEMSAREKEHAAKSTSKNAAKHKGDKIDTEDGEMEPPFVPALGGIREKTDPRFANKGQATKKGGKADAGQERDNLQARQNDNERNLDAAEKSLASDQKTLAEMLQDLEESLRKQGKGKPSSQGEQSEAEHMAEQLRQLMQSQAMRQAMEMAGRMREAKQGRPQPGQAQSNPSQVSMPHSQAHRPPGSKQADLSEFDPQTRAMILKLPPSRLRDELILGMSEQGPEAYRAFIQDYFKRLTDTKAPVK
jgi:hypothetical protein